MGSTAFTELQCFYRASVPVQYTYTSTPPMGLQPVQSLSACKLHLKSIPPIGRTASTEPQSLYSTAITLLPL